MTEAIANAVNEVAAGIMAHANGAGAGIRVTGGATAGHGFSARKWYSITNKDSSSAEVKIYEDIGAWGVSAKQFADDIEGVKAETLHVRLNTDGGEVFDGLAIFNALRAHPARIVVHVDGLAASSGSLVAMSGDEIRMADNAFLMIHEARGGVLGEADDMRQYADILDKLNDTLATTYAARAGKTRKYWREKMADETWFTAEEAKAEGLVDTIDDRETAAASATNRFDFRIYNHAKDVPEAVRRAWGKPDQQPAPELSPRGEPLPDQPKEIPPMADTPTTAPAPTPAAGNQPQSQVTIPDAPAFKSVQDAVKHFQSVAGPAFVEQGRRKGYAEGEAAAAARLAEIVAACPGKPAMALAAFDAGQTPAAVRLAFDEAARVEAAAKMEQDAAQMEIARLNTILSLGGHPGVSMGMENGDSPTGMEPKAQAAFEWDRNPEVRKGFTSKENYVNVRTAELEGRFTRQTSARQVAAR